MRRLAAIAAVGVGLASAALADAPPSHYEITPLTKADVDLYFSVMRPAVAYIQNAKGEDRAAIDYMKKNHGNPQFPAAPNVSAINGMPTQAQMAEMNKEMADYTKKTEKPREYMSRAMTLGNYDEEIAKQRHIAAKYDAVKDPIETGMDEITGAVGDCGGDCGPAIKPTAAQKALWKKEDDVVRANTAFLKPYAPEILKLRKALHDVEIGQ